MMKETATVEDTLIGSTAINAMITNTHRDRMNAEKLEKAILNLGVKPLGNDGRRQKPSASARMQEEADKLAQQQAAQQAVNDQRGKADAVVGPTR